MKILIILSFLFNFGLCCAQQRDVVNSAEVEYKCEIESDLPTSLFTTLYINNNVSIFKEKTSTAVRGKFKDDDGSYTTLEPLIVFEPFLKVDRSNKKVLFFEMIGANTFLVEDDYHNLDWTITEETKSVAGFSCNKAIASFRGRQWIVWFTTQIPLSFGPWKLHGLPGLILEAYDSTNKYTWKAVKVEFAKSTVFNKDFDSLMNTKNSKPISYQQFLRDTEEYRENVSAEMDKKYGRSISRTQAARNGKELVFEWE